MYNENQAYLNPSQSKNTNIEKVGVSSPKEQFFQHWQKIVAAEEENSHQDEQTTFLADSLSSVAEEEVKEKKSKIRLKLQT